MHRLLAELVAELPDEYRQVVHLRYVEEREPADIARLLQQPPGTIRWRLHEAMSRLRRASTMRRRPESLDPRARAAGGLAAGGRRIAAAGGARGEAPQPGRRQRCTRPAVAMGRSWRRSLQAAPPLPPCGPARAAVPARGLRPGGRRRDRRAARGGGLEPAGPAWRSRTGAAAPRGGRAGTAARDPPGPGRPRLAAQAVAGRASRPVRRSSRCAGTSLRSRQRPTLAQSRRCVRGEPTESQAGGRAPTHGRGVPRRRRRPGAISRCPAGDRSASWPS